MDPVQFRAIPTVVGSFPDTDAPALLERIFAKLPLMPAWPQLPVRDFRESMYIQYSEGFPGAVLDADNERLHFEVGESFYPELESFLQAVVGEDVDHFVISPDYAQGLHLFLERARKQQHGEDAWLKGQVTGPFSFGMTVTDENKRSIAYNPELNEVTVQGIAGKARWMARRLKEVWGRALVVLDEPYLCSFGSAFVNVSREDVTTSLNTVIEAIHAEGVLAGIHCCGNTDWSLPLSTQADVVNLDAYEFFQGLPLYPDELRAFLSRGGTISWGIVPTSDAAIELDTSVLLAALDDRIAELVAKGLDRDQLLAQALLTPSCGMGSKSEELSNRVLDLLVDLSERVREREGFR